MLPGLATYFGCIGSPGLADAYAKNPERNLLGPLAVLSIAGAVFRLSPELLRPEAVDSESRVTQLYVRLAQGAWNDDAEIQRLLQQFASADAEREGLTVDLGLMTLTNCSQNGGLQLGEAVRLVLALHRQMKDTASTGTWRTFAFLSAALARRLSPLQESEKWKQLELPDLSTTERPTPYSRGRSLGAI
jgi:hypothetical protein